VACDPSGPVLNQLDVPENDLALQERLRDTTHSEERLARPERPRHVLDRNFHRSAIQIRADLLSYRRVIAHIIQVPSLTTG